MSDSGNKTMSLWDSILDLFRRPKGSVCTAKTTKNHTRVASDTVFSQLEKRLEKNIDSLTFPNPPDRAPAAARAPFAEDAGIPKRHPKCAESVAIWSPGDTIWIENSVPRPARNGEQNAQPRKRTFGRPDPPGTV